MDQQNTLVPVLKFTRVQSPSSINTFNQCQRKYYYQYIAKLPTSPSIHLLRGNIVHNALEEFFTIDLTPALNNDFSISLRMVLLEFFNRSWKSKEKELLALGLPLDTLEFYHDESVRMLELWYSSFSENLNLLSKKYGVHEAFRILTPIVEQEFISTTLGVRGFIDAVYNIDGKVTIMDYKTSSKDIITLEYKLQLAIYALLYNEKHGVVPDRLGISFLKFGDRYLEFDKGILDFAKREILFVHENTLSTDVKDYGKKVSPLCKWSSGQCDFYDICFKN